MHVLHLLMYVPHILTIDARTCIEEEILPAAISTYLLPYVRTYCTYLVLVYLLMYIRTYCTYCCPYGCTYVGTPCTAFTNAISTHLVYKTAKPTVHYCCTYN